MFSFIRGWTDIARTSRANVRLGAFLAFVAGAANAGGFLAVGQYTSHMTGLVSSIADNLVLGQVLAASAAAGAIGAFIGGAMSTAVVVNWSLRRGLHSAYSLPLLIEAGALLAFGIFGASINAFGPVFIPATVLLLCYIMGLQNAVITKISRAEIRTTHVTGLLTDIGIELGKLAYVNRTGGRPPVLANRDRLRIHTLLASSFLVGGLAGALGFKFLGFVSTLPLAAGLVLLALRPLLRDLRLHGANRGH